MRAGVCQTYELMDGPVPKEQTGWHALGNGGGYASERRRGKPGSARPGGSGRPPPPPDLDTGPYPCQHTWGEPETVRFSPDSRDEIQVCEKRQGFVHRCWKCRGYHLVQEGQDCEYSMPPWVSELWQREHGCRGEKFGDLIIPFVRMPTGHDPPMFDLATNGEMEDQPGGYELWWFS